MVKEFEGEFPGVVAEYEIAVVNDHKVVTMLNVVDMDAFSFVIAFYYDLCFLPVVYVVVFIATA